MIANKNGYIAKNSYQLIGSNEDQNKMDLIFTNYKNFQSLKA